MSVDPFPNELVEAAAKALAGEWHMVSKDLRARWDSVLPDDNPGVPENWLARAVLAAVLPRIEQREVRERTTREIVEALRERPPGAGTTYGLVADSIERSFLSSGVGSQALSPGGVDRACEHKPGVSRAYLNEEGSDGA